jgi:hypothetical protein
MGMLFGHQAAKVITLHNYSDRRLEHSVWTALHADWRRERQEHLLLVGPQWLLRRAFSLVLGGVGGLLSLLRWWSARPRHFCQS